MFNSYDLRGIYRKSIKEDMIFSLLYGLVKDAQNEELKNNYPNNNFSYKYNTQENNLQENDNNNQEEQRLDSQINPQKKINLEVTVRIAYDFRSSSYSLANAARIGVTAAGGSVDNLGIIPIPILYYISHVDNYLNTEDNLSENLITLKDFQQNTKKNNKIQNKKAIIHIMITASHNSESYSGIKILYRDRSLNGSEMMTIINNYQNISYLFDKYNESNNYFNINNSNKYWCDNYILYLNNTINNKNIFCNVSQKYHSSDIKLKVVWNLGKSTMLSIIPKVINILDNKFSKKITHFINTNTLSWDYNPYSNSAQFDSLNEIKNKEKVICFSFDGDGDRISLIGYKVGGNILDNVVEYNNNFNIHENISIIENIIIFLLKFINFPINTEKNIFYDKFIILYDVNTSKRFINYISKEYPNIIGKFCTNGHTSIKNIMKNNKDIIISFESSGHIYIRQKIFNNYAIYEDPILVSSLIISILVNNNLNDNNSLKIDYENNCTSKKIIPKAKIKIIEIKLSKFYNKINKSLIIKNIIYYFYKYKRKYYYNNKSIKYKKNNSNFYEIDYKDQHSIRISNKISYFSMHFSRTEDILRIKIDTIGNINKIYIEIVSAILNKKIISIKQKNLIKKFLNILKSIKKNIKRNIY
ncbi:hypothetical protein [Lyticum sinuosum]|uniref:Phosphomannomutase domain protein n=1 Tax=Lyticum sinuosum TaxID=1332059 RepID=A0AAE5AH47_9RICK|nr:hypothetical protein [Lyticum sinuosum]MDZ5761567.1 putative phosphomannomutase domain protein [Lyticum sinuosum]